MRSIGISPLAIRKIVSGLMRSMMVVLTEMAIGFLNEINYKENPNMQPEKNKNKTLNLTEDQLKSAKAWNDLITDKVGAAVGATLDGDFVAANYTPGFNYVIKQLNYNAETLAALDTRVEESDGVPVLKDSYTTLYKNVIDNLKYDYSKADLSVMNDEAVKLSAMTESVINEFTQTDLYDPSQSDITISFIMEQITEKTGADYMNLDTVKYFQYANLCNLLKSYARQATFTSKMQSLWYAAYNRLQAISQHITTPTAENGAFKTDSGDYVCAWDSLPESAALLERLKSGSSIAFSIEVSDFTESESEFRFESDVSCRVPFSWFLSVVNVDHKHEYDLTKYACSGASLKIDVEYNGITLVPAVPHPLSDDNSKGWFASDILEEAAAKSGRDATGYQLIGGDFDPDKIFGENGQLRRIKTFVLSQQPAVTLTFTNFDFSEVEKDFKQETDVEFKFLGGLISGSHDNEYTFSDYSYDRSANTTTIKILPAPLAGSGSSAKQTAFVLGGSVESFKRDVNQIYFAKAKPTETGKELALTWHEDNNLFALYEEDESGKFVYSGVIDKTKDCLYRSKRTVAVPLRSTVAGHELFNKGQTVYNVQKSTNDKPKGWIGIWLDYMKNKNLKPQDEECYVAGSNAKNCNKFIIGGHMVKQDYPVQPSAGADFVYIVPICNKHNNAHNTGAMEICKNVYALTLHNYLNNVPLAERYEELLNKI